MVVSARSIELAGKSFVKLCDHIRSVIEVERELIGL